MLEWLSENTWVIYSVIIYVSFKLGYWMHEAYFLYLLQEYPERFEMAIRVVRKARVDPKEALKLGLQLRTEHFGTTPEYEQLTMECMNNIWYAYSKSGEFLAQGATMKDVFSVLNSRFPNRKFIGNLDQEDSAK